MESKDKQETVLPDAMPEQIPMHSNWKRSGVALFVVVLCGTLFMGLLRFGDSDAVQADNADNASQDESSAPCQAPEKITVRRVKPLGVDRSECLMLPNIGEAKCRAGEVGMRIGRSENGFRRVYCGGCEKLIYPTDKHTTVNVTMNGGGK